ncbi:MAG: aminopeptidase P family protein [Microscillaceae bacterium]
MTRYTLPTADLFEQNRQKLVAQLLPNSLVILQANDIMPTNADGTMPFRQNSDLFYLTGVDQEESILVLFPDCPDEKMREVLFLRETSEEIAIWEGEKLSKAQARALTGIAQVHWLADFDRIFHTLMGLCENVYLSTNEHSRAVIALETRNARFIRQCQQKYPLHHYRRLYPLMEYLRAVKSPPEIALIQQAIDITEKGFRRILPFVKPGVWEYEIEAEFAHEFIRQRSRGFAYTPIIAAGANSCVLHYIENARQCREGDLLLMDVGAEYGNYAADMTRTIPVNGRFTLRQKQVYQAVLRVMRQATQMLKPGNLWEEYHKAVGEVMSEELVNLGLLTMDEVKNAPEDRPAYKKYFMHGTSHHLGLDVHDLGHRYRPFAPGMVFTCEPGIYIREEGLGIRLENNILITETGQIDLMANIPVEPEEIETLMQA